MKHGRGVILWRAGFVYRGILESFGAMALLLSLCSVVLSSVLVFQNVPYRANLLHFVCACL